MRGWERGREGRSLWGCGQRAVPHTETSIYCFKSNGGPAGGSFCMTHMGWGMVESPCGICTINIYPYAVTTDRHGVTRGGPTHRWSPGAGFSCSLRRGGGGPPGGGGGGPELHGLGFAVLAQPAAGALPRGGRRARLVRPLDGAGAPADFPVPHGDMETNPAVEREEGCAGRFGGMNPARQY